MIQSTNSKKYDLEERTLVVAKDVRILLKKLPKTISNIEDGKQLARSSGSVGANYIEANESLSRKDFVLRIKICRKEAKESIYWLKLIDLTGMASLEPERERIIGEVTELMKIFGAIIEKCK